MSQLGLPTLPDLVHDETLYSWCATVHAMNTGLSAAQTGVHLLGSPHAPKQHDLPASLTRIPLLLDKSPAQRIQLLRKHTIAGFYWPFTSESARQSVASHMLAGTPHHWRRTLCASSRTQPIEHPLKWCPGCVAADLVHIGRAYWHVQHQFPTTTVCRLHGNALRQIFGRHKTWVLPPTLPACGVSSQPTSALIPERIGAALNDIDAIDLSFLRASSLRCLRNTGVIFSFNGASHERIEEWFSHTLTAAWCTATGNGLEKLADGKWISPMLWRRHLGNAVRWVVLWSALMSESPLVTLADFRDACRGVGHDFGGQLTLFGYPAGIPARAPDIVWNAFSESSSYADVMSKLRRSRGDVVRWLELDPELRRQWRQRLRSERQDRCLGKLHATISATPSLTRKALEKQFPADVRWLRQHAPRELNDLLKAIPARGAGQVELFSLAPTR